MQLKSDIEETVLENPEHCPNCGHYVGEEATCSNCGAVLFNDSDELNPFDEDEGETLDF